MNLTRDGNVVDEVTYIRTAQSIQKMQEITDRLATTTPDINKSLPLIPNSLFTKLWVDINADSLLKPQKTYGQEQILIYPNKKNELLEMNKKKKSWNCFCLINSLKKYRIKSSHNLSTGSECKKWDDCEWLAEKVQWNYCYAHQGERKKPNSDPGHQ